MDYFSYCIIDYILFFNERKKHCDDSINSSQWFTWIIEFFFLLFEFFFLLFEIFFNPLQNTF